MAICIPVCGLVHSRMQHGVPEADFEGVFVEQNFEETGPGGRTVEYVPGGSRLRLTYANRGAFASAALAHRLHEFDAPVGAMRRGLGAVVPLGALALFTWSELETAVCGTPTVDVGLLRSVAVYEGCGAGEPHVVLFWAMLEAFSQVERREFLRFVWGRTRLPLSAAEFSRKFTIARFSKPLSHLPEVHTCFFKLDLPAYPSAEVMAAKFRLAIGSCTTVDGDFGARDVSTEGDALDTSESADEAGAPARPPEAPPREGGDGGREAFNVMLTAELARVMAAATRGGDDTA